jgi:predicted CopG family antitoxin
MVKTITIRDAVYEKLSSVKGEDESFSQLLDRLVEGADPLDTLRVLRGSVEFRDKEGFLKEVGDLRGERRL